MFRVSDYINDELAERGLSHAAFFMGVECSDERWREISVHGMPITDDEARRLGRYFGTSARLWMNLQAAQTVWLAEKEKQDAGNA